MAHCTCHLGAGLFEASPWLFRPLHGVAPGSSADPPVQSSRSRQCLRLNLASIAINWALSRLGRARCGSTPRSWRSAREGAEGGGHGTSIRRWSQNRLARPL